MWNPPTVLNEELPSHVMGRVLAYGLWDRALCLAPIPAAPERQLCPEHLWRIHTPAEQRR